MAMPARDRSGSTAAAFLWWLVSYGWAYEVWCEDAFWVQLPAEFLNLKFGPRSNNRPDMAATHEAKAAAQYQMRLP